MLNYTEPARFRRSQGVVSLTPGSLRQNLGSYQGIALAIPYALQNRCPFRAGIENYLLRSLLGIAGDAVGSRILRCDACR